MLIDLLQRLTSSLLLISRLPQQTNAQCPPSLASINPLIHSFTHYPITIHYLLPAHHFPLHSTPLPTSSTLCASSLLCACVCVCCVCACVRNELTMQFFAIHISLAEDQTSTPTVATIQSIVGWYLFTKQHNATLPASSSLTQLDRETTPQHCASACVGNTVLYTLIIVLLPMHVSTPNQPSCSHFLTLPCLNMGQSHSHVQNTLVKLRQTKK